MRNSRYRRQPIKDFIIESTRFTATVLFAAILSVWLQNHLSRLPSGAIAKSQEIPQVSSPQVSPIEEASTADAPEPQEDLNGFYARYLEDVLKTLRADRKVRMVRLELPNVVLNYQRFLASQETESGLRLQGRAATIPFIAVSRGSKPFLDEMKVAYVDPKVLPPRLIDPSSVVLSRSALQKYLLIPDLSGTGSLKYFFARR